MEERCQEIDALLVRKALGSWPSEEFPASNSDRNLSTKCFSLLMHILIDNSREPGNLFQRYKSLSWFYYKRLMEAHLVARAFTSALPPALECLTLHDLLASGDCHLIRFPRLLRLREVILIDNSEISIMPFFHDDGSAKAERLVFTTTSSWFEEQGGVP